MRRNFLLTLLIIYSLLIFFLFIGSIKSSLNQNELKAQVQVGSPCQTAQDCHSLNCEYPQATYCTTGEVTSGFCVCMNWDQQPSWNNGCLGNPYVEPPACPQGWEDCGTSVDHAGDPFCIKQENLLVVGRCPGCDNPSIIYRYCRQSVDLPGCYEQCNATFGCRDNLVCDTTRGVCVNPEFPDSPTCQAQYSTFCGNAICDEGELCERVEENSQTFRRCTTLGAPPSGQLVANCRDILNSSNEPPTQYSCTFCGDGIRQSNEECDYAVDENCNLNCMFEESQTSMSIDKRILNERTYLIGEQINFEIIITNTGNTTLNVVEFWDRWDSNYIRFNNGYIIKNNLTINDISQIITEQNNSQIYIADITNSILGDLEPGESFLIYLNFTAVNPTPFYVGETCNNAIASGDEIPEVRDKVCLYIQNQNTDL